MRVVGRVSRVAEAQRQDQLLSMSHVVACNQDLHHQHRSNQDLHHHNQHRSKQDLHQNLQQDLHQNLHQDLHQQYRSILGQLSLFYHSPDGKETPDQVQEEGPVAAASEGAATTPASLDDLCDQLQRRIREQSALHWTPAEDQQALLVVMTSELGLIWQDLKGQTADPTLTQEENQTLQSRTVEEVLRICQQLYLSYCHLLDTLSRRAVFSPEANRSRLAAQMASDCTTLLSVHSIRRGVALGIKAARRARPRAEGCSDERGQEGAAETHATPPRKLELCLQAQTGSKKTGASRPIKNPLERDVREMTEKMRDLDLERVYGLIPCHLERITRKGDAHYGVHVSSPLTSKTDQDLDEENIYCNHYTRLKGCSSMPDLQRELELEALPARPRSPLVLLATGPPSCLETPVDPADDLRRLVQGRVSVEQAAADPEADLPPLIKALSWSSSTRLHSLQQALKRLEEEEEQEEEERRRLRRLTAVQQPQIPQAAVVGVAQTRGGVVRTAAARVSDRVLPDAIHIQMYPAVYNDLTKELELSSVRWLDRNLFAGAEIKEVYRELSKSMSTQYLNFDEDPMIEPVLTSTKYSLRRRNHERSINPGLKRHNPHGLSLRKRLEVPVEHQRPADVNSRAYATWLQWWKTNLSLDDYLQYISSQDSDYLGAVFHLYDSDDSDDEEDERRRRLQLQQEETERRQREKMEALKRQKQEYVTGVWNVNAVLLGGLGKDPLLKEEERPGEDITSSSKQKAPRPLGEEGGGGAKVELLQSRLERIWTLLCLSDAQRLDMAIKYSSHTHRDQLEEATAAWERAAHLIQQRESVLARLELFEREASDPTRFFQPGYKGTSIARMEEARQREKLNGQISSLEKVLSKTIHHITDCFHDTVTYKGRPYAEKQRWDRIEMLYWLQQERRVQALEQRGILPARLPPLDPTPHALPPH